MARVITIGETMAALTPGSSGALRYVTDYRIRIAGAESNVAVGLSKLGIETVSYTHLDGSRRGGNPVRADV